MEQKKRVLLIGGGGVGTMAALNLERGGLAEVTMVLRSNYEAVKERGYKIDSCDHGNIEGWRPSHILPSVPTSASPPYDYLLLTTKNTPDIPPSLPHLISPAVTPDHTTILLLQNGLNIHHPFLPLFPHNPLLSGVSMIGSLETSPGHVVQNDPDRLLVGGFPGQSAERVPPERLEQVAKEFVRMYAAGGKTQCSYSEEVMRDRWRKLIYNACLNPICALTSLDTGRLRLVDDGALVRGLLKPAMEEIKAAAAAAGYVLDEDVVGRTVEMDPVEAFLVPSMLMDVKNGGYIEFENLVGDPLREGKKLGVEMRTVEVLYWLCRAYQWRVREGRGVVRVTADGRVEVGGE